MKSPSIELPFPASRRRKYYVATQELLRGDAGKGARRGEGKGEWGMEKVNEVNEVNGEFGESDGKRIPEKGFFIKNILYNNVRA